MGELSLAHNRIGNPGAKNLARVLNKRPALRELDLQNNLIGPQGLEKLCKACYSGLTLRLENNATGNQNVSIGTDAISRVKKSTLGVKKSDSDSDVASTPP